MPLALEPYPNMAAEDEITLLWGDVRFDLPKLAPADVGKPVTVFVPAAVILALKPARTVGWTSPTA